MIELTDSTEMISQLFWEDLTVTVPVEDDECSGKVWRKFSRKKCVKILTILEGGNAVLSTLKCIEKRICISIKLNIYRSMIYRKIYIYI